MTNAKKDLFILVADTTMKSVLEGLLSRAKSLKIKAPSYDIYVHPNHDSGCFKQGPAFLKHFTNQYDYCLLIFDYEGCGNEDMDPNQIMQDLERDLASSGWANRNAVVVINPELEIWVWSDSPHVKKCLGWGNIEDDFNTHSETKGFWNSISTKPNRPKEAMESALRIANVPKSSSIYKELAKNVSLKRCRDSAFNKLKDTLQEWFPST